MAERTFIISEINGESVIDWNVTLDIKGARKYVLVAAVNFHENVLLGNFSKHAESYMLKKTATFKEGEMNTFILVNMGKGEIITYEYKGKNKIKETPELPKYDPIIDSDYYAGIHPNPQYARNRFFDPMSKKCISKYTFYDMVEKIGIDDPETLIELNVFSHAYFDGPILVDSVQRTGSNDPKDFDMRRTDISSYYANDPIKKDNFKKAFHNTQGIIKLWGCSFPRDTNALYSKLRKDKNKIYQNSTPINDTDKLVYPKNHFWFMPSKSDNTPLLDSTGKPVQIDLTNQINGSLRTTYKVDAEIELTGLQIKQFMSYQYYAVFASFAAESFDIKIQAALPATYSEFNTKEFTGVSSNTFNTVKMYEVHLDVKIGELHYGIYDKATVTRLKAI
ncbi:hypothetical protein [uncultured Flavobacterium sp.]|uniref:hypothetical protein n=1 Tax=uncultured Flavobacterium sp. TaxID=165435 RepID=UPI0025E2D6B9|nr:hypothetical protein [uncultured Flavobacterium sp.]